jgi:endo-1,4-beta-xylanase
MMITRALSFVTAAILLFQVGAAAQEKAQDAQARQRERAAQADEPPQWVKPPIEAIHVQHRTFQSKYANGPVSYLIYLPAGYETSGKRYPVMYWLHGRGGGQQGIPGFAGRLTKAIESGEAPAMIVVFVNGLPTGGYRDSADGKQPVESVAIKELIPHIDATYRTIATREGRLVEGFSMGGSGAAKWGFKFADLFGSIGVFAGAMHGRGSPAPIPPGLNLSPQDDPWALAEQNADRVRGKSVIRITVGGKDGLVKSNTAFHELLDKLRIEHQFAVIEGVAHTPWPLYDALGDKCWTFYHEAFRIKHGR